jgi:hypothetical protein
MQRHLTDRVAPAHAKLLRLTCSERLGPVQDGPDLIRGRQKEDGVDKRDFLMKVESHALRAT